ncbi:MAG TPA: sigma 54-interacting transcriptional regulator [Kofleriaceae bacterium]|nr:sigma 54-interacting transcriptional regulator [Kofleriaceae bacterium]
MDDTASLQTGHGASRAGEPSWYLVLALEASRPFAGAQRLSLDGVDQVAVGRGERRSVSRDVARLRVELDDRFQSKEHFRLTRSGAGWELEDLESKNGTRRRGRRTQRDALDDGDVIEAGASFFVLREATVAAPNLALVPEPHDTLRTLHAGLGDDLALLSRLAPSRLPILVRGESGSGKELAARTIHALSKRRGPLVAVNCGALPAALAEAELFGARRGAFSGAVEDRPGLVRTADGGTLFLDEVADLPLPAQAALLRFVQEGEVRSLGAHHTAKVDVRLIAATHRDLDAMITKETFRSDLAARLRGHALGMPALRDRREDLGVICAELLQRMTDSTGSARTLEPAAVRALFAHPWPGNVRELDHALRFAVARAGSEITLADLPESVRTPADPPTDATPAPIDQRARLVALVAEHSGNLSAVARALQTSRSQVRRLLERYGIELKPS